jgi:cobalt-zinc-cadmium efflux system protein
MRQGENMTDDDRHLPPGAVMDVSARRSGRLAVALGLNVVVVIGQVVFGLLARSLGLVADAGHNLTDVIALAVSLVAIRLALRRPTRARSFGYHRGTVLAAQFNALSILAVAVVIVVEGVRRLTDPGEIEGAVVVVVATAAAMVNGLSALFLREPHDHARSGGGHGGDLNVRSAMLHMVSDALASVGVAASGLVILVTGGYHWLDPLVSLMLTVLIAVHAWRLLRETTDVLLESTPGNVDVDALAAAVLATPGVDAVHDLHVWSLSSDVRALSAHVLLAGQPTLAEAQRVGDAVRQAIGDRFAIAHATLELECTACVSDAPFCAIDDTARPPQRR